MKRYAITGHTQGIGKRLFELLGDSCVGFSRTTGYDITKKADRVKIIAESSECDVFINNASDGLGQTLLLIELFREWQHTNKTIINVGSRIAEFEIACPNLGLLEYQAEKLILKEMSERLTNISNCNIVYKWFGYVGTEKIIKKYPHFTENDYISVDNACKIILS